MPIRGAAMVAPLGTGGRRRMSGRPARRRLAATALGAAMLMATAGGCAVGPDYKRPPVPLRPAWSQPGDPRLVTQSPVDAAWWHSFNDPTLDQLIELSYHQNLPLQIAGLRIYESRAQLGI